MEFVQITLTTNQTHLLAQACIAAGMTPELPDDLSTALADLAGFFQDVTDNPRAFTPTGKMARSIKMRKRRMKVTLAGLR